MFEIEVYLMKHCLVSVYDMDNDDYNNNVWKWSIPDETLFSVYIIWIMMIIIIMFESEVYLMKHCLVSVYNMDNDNYNNNGWKWSIPDETLFSVCV